MGQKSSKAELDKRVHEVVRLLSMAKTTHWICRFASDEWGVDPRTAQRYIARAREIIRAEYDVERSEFLASRMTILDKVIESSIASGQHSNAVGALKLQAELTRLMDRR